MWQTSRRSREAFRRFTFWPRMPKVSWWKFLTTQLLVMAPNPMICDGRQYEISGFCFMSRQPTVDPSGSEKTNLGIWLLRIWFEPLSLLTTTVFVHLTKSKDVLVSEKVVMDGQRRRLSARSELSIFARYAIRGIGYQIFWKSINCERNIVGPNLK